MSLDPETRDRLLEGYLDGALEASEMSRLDAALQADRDLRDEFRRRVRTHGLLSRHYELEDATAALSPIQPLHPMGKESEPVSRIRGIGWWPAAAAAAILGLLVVIGLLEFPGSGNRDAGSTEFARLCGAVQTRNEKA